MVRAFGLLGLLLGVVVMSGCGGEGGPPVASSPAEAIDAPRYAQESTEELSLDFAIAPPAAPDPLAIPAPVLPELERQETTPVEIGTAINGREAGSQRALLGSYGGTGIVAGTPQVHPVEGVGPGEGGDKFAHLEENTFLAVKDAPLSTFSIDVDTASYSKTRAFLMERHALPPKDAVRIEELINYFDYSYAGPSDEQPFAVHLETAECPWQPKHRLVRCGLQGKKLDGNRPVSNLVFLIDVSGSMNQPNKLPLVQRSLSMLVRQLGENDRVSIVVYAGAAGLVLSPTIGSEHPTILAAIENLRAGGSTNGGQGIQLSYKLAQENFIKGGTNRVILCSDGDFNVGVTSTGELIRLATEKAQAGIYLSVLGFGIGNHNDAMLEQLSNKANGNYAFIDSDAEARKVFVEQLEGTLVTIAKDVKIQVEFNPAEVAAYRLIGYENRRLANRDFNDDKKDAGDIGAGHRVTVLYEIVPVGIESDLTKPLVDPLKYQGTEQEPAKKEALSDAARSGELLTLKLRYQLPAGGVSTLMTFPVKDSGQRFSAATPDFQFAAAVASFGMLLRDSKFKGNTSYSAVLETAIASRGPDKQGLRAEFLQIVAAAKALTPVAEPEPVPAAEPAAATSSTGAWIRLPSGELELASLGPMPVVALGAVYVTFFVGLSVGIVAVLFVILFSLGLISLRASLLANPLPAAKKFAK